jgi:hypothetical protein
MRFLLVPLVVVVFGAMWLFDTAALLRLAGLCLTGGCGVRTPWVVGGLVAGVLLLVALAWWQRPRRKGKASRTSKKPASRRKPAAQRNPKRAK